MRKMLSRKSAAAGAAVVGTWDGVISARSAAEGSSVDRHYRVRVPNSYDPSSPMPLLFVLGGFQVDLYFLPGYTELDRSSELSDVIVVYLSLSGVTSEATGFRLVRLRVGLGGFLA